MLILWRRTGERIRITVGKDVIDVLLVGVTPNNTARIGVSAPAHIRVDREEVARRRDAGEIEEV